MSTILLSALVLGVFSPTGMCALMCERHSRADSRDRCSQNASPMPGMAHADSAMHHHALRNISLVVESQSCQRDCAVAERLNISRKVVPQVTVVVTTAVAMDATFKFLVPGLRAACNLDSGPPSPPPAFTASYSVLRI
jgi:hypothetical protein